VTEHNKQHGYEKEERQKEIRLDYNETLGTRPAISTKENRVSGNFS
jgi:hypothetical protein